jgi:hypothetical protein
VAQARQRLGAARFDQAYSAGSGLVGNSSAFSALAPSQRPMYDAHQPKIFESGISIMSPGPNTWTLNIQPLDQFRPHCGRSTLSNTVACLLHTAR